MTFPSCVAHPLCARTAHTRSEDDEALEELEEVLIMADLGPATAAKLTANLAREKFDKEVTDQEVREALAEDIAQMLEPVALPLAINPAHKPHVVLVTGVNGVGKTTTIGKLAQQFRADGKRVVMAAGDTFRAAAVEQLQIWADRTGAQFVSGKHGADAAGRHDDVSVCLGYRQLSQRPARVVLDAVVIRVGAHGGDYEGNAPRRRDSLRSNSVERSSGRRAQGEGGRVKRVVVGMERWRSSVDERQRSCGRCCAHRR